MNKVYVVLYADDLWDEERVMDKIFAKKEDAEVYRDQAATQYRHLSFIVEEVDVQ